MSGTSHGLTQHLFIGARISTGGNPGKEKELLYIPAHIKADGKAVSSRLTIPILVNMYGKQEPSGFTLVAWGALADMFAKNLSQGKEMNFICDASSYWGNVFYNDGLQILQKDGRTPVQTRQTSFTIRSFTWGSDSNRTKMEEINAGMKSGEGRRPAQWDSPGTPDNEQWRRMLDLRKQTYYMGGERFGYAKVVAPRTPGYTIQLGDQSKILRTQDAPVQAAVLPAAPNAPLVHEVASTLAPPVQGALPAVQAPA